MKSTAPCEAIEALGLDWRAAHEQRAWRLALSGTPADAARVTAALGAQGLQARVIASGGAGAVEFFGLTAAINFPVHRPEVRISATDPGCVKLRLKLRKLPVAVAVRTSAWPGTAPMRGGAIDARGRRKGGTVTATGGAVDLARPPRLRADDLEEHRGELAVALDPLAPQPQPPGEQGSARPNTTGVWWTHTLSSRPASAN